MTNKVEVNIMGIMSRTRRDIDLARDEILLAMEKYPSKRCVLWDGGDFHRPSDEILADALKMLRVLDQFLPVLSDAINTGKEAVLTVSNRDGLTKTLSFSEQL